MNGRSCIAFNSEDKQNEVLADLIETCDYIMEAAWIIRGLAIDDLGTGRIYYWPKVAWPEG